MGDSRQVLSDTPSPRAAVSDLHGADGVHLRDYLRLVVRRRHLVFTALAGGVLIAALHAFTATPLFEGRTQLLIEAEDPNVVTFTQVVDEGQARQDYYMTQLRLIQSRSVARR